MKNIIIIVLIATCFAACKKELAEINGLQEKNGQQNMVAQAINNCNGNTWQYQGQIYIPGVGDYTIVYNNKYYQLLPVIDKIRIYDGVSWDTIDSQIPLNPNTYYFGVWPLINYQFVIGNKGYFGYCGDPIFNDATSTQYLYEYNFLTNTWQSRAKFPASARQNVSFFSIGNKGYIAGGYNFQNDITLKETWEYDAVNNSWSQKANLPTPRFSAAAFTIGNNGFIVNGSRKVGSNFQALKTLYRYNPAVNVWYDQPAFPGAARNITQTFVINGLAYAGGGEIINDQGSSLGIPSDFYQYNPQNYTWKKVADFPLADKHKYRAFSINSRGYVPYSNGTPTQYMYKYTPLSCIVGGTTP